MVTNDGPPHGLNAAGATTTAEPCALQGVLELSPDAVLLVGAHGRIVAVNRLAEELLGYRAAELHGQPVEVLVPEAVRGDHPPKRDAFAATPVHRRMGTAKALHAQRRDGSCFPADIGLRPVVVDGATMTVVAVRDLSPQQQLEQRNSELEEHAGALRRFVDVASHELRTPLTAIRGFAETLQRAGISEPERSALLDGLIRNARRQQVLIDDLLDLSRLQHATHGAQLRPVAVAPIAAELCAELDAVTIDLAGVADSWVLADPGLLTQILTNLLSNAVRYGAAPISVEAAPGPPLSAGDEAKPDEPGSLAPRVVLTVRDHGPGVDPGFEVQLFTAFTQQSVGDAREAVGLGLGLYLSKQWATAMGGMLRFRPNQPTGACFELHLPASAPARG